MIRGIWQTSISPFTGFGDDPATAIKFGIDLTGQDTMPDWTGGEATVNRFRILHSNDVIKQYSGRDERELTLRLWFASRDDLEALDDVQGRAATLRYKWGLTSRAGGTKQVIADVAYLVLPDTELVRLADQRTPIGGWAEATATFRRPVGVGVLYDYAHYAEED